MSSIEVDKGPLEFTKLDVMERAAKIADAMTREDPALGTHLEAIRMALLKNEELIHILPDEVINRYVAGLQKFKNIKLLEEAIKSKGTRGKKNNDPDLF
jgi:hypothetical protein